MHQFLPSQILTRQFFIVLLLVFFFVTNGYGQPASLSWPLTADAIALASGNVSGSNQLTNGAGTSVYVSDGVSTDSWATGAVPDAGKYYEFTLSPSANHNFFISNISIDNNTDGISGTALIQYAYDAAFTSPVTVGSSFAVSTGASSTTNFNSLSIAVNNGQTLYIRVFAWDIENSSKLFNTRNFTVSGNTILCVPDVSNFTMLTPSAVCAGSSVNVTVNSSSLSTDNYFVTYDLGGANTATSLNASLSFTSGTPGTGTFTIPATALNNTGNTTVTITSITNTNLCSANISSGNIVSLVVTLLPSATFSYSASPYCASAVNPFPTFSGAGGAGIFSSTPGLVFVNTATGEINLSASTPGTYTVTNTIAAGGGCVIVTETSDITITADNTIVLTSSTGTEAQALCINTALTNITYATTGATGATFSGLPAGVTGSWFGNTVTVSGTPTVNGTFNYMVTLTGGCANITTNGSISVSANNSVNLTSPAGTDAQTRCINTAIANITYSTTGATGASFIGLPAGVTGNWSANVATISGTPIASGAFNYTVTITGGCGNITVTGTIAVTANNTVNRTSPAGTDAQTRCINVAIANITYATVGANGASFTGLPAGVTGNWVGNMATISGTPTSNGTFNYTITLTGGCGVTNATGSIVVTPNNTVTLTSPGGTTAQTRCINTPITNITYSTTGATGATFSGLPAGVTGSWAGNVISITGTPTTSGTFNYIATLNGGCAVITATGSITVYNYPAATGITICQNGAGSLTSAAACAIGTTNTPGPNPPTAGATAGTGTAWANPGNVVSDNNAHATVSGTGTAFSRSLNATGFGFAIPTGAIINGIQVTISRFRSGGIAGEIQDNSVRLLKAGVATGANNGATSTNWPTGEAAANYGNTGDLWGVTWTPAEINAANFGVALVVDNTNGTFSRQANVDYFQIRVTYTIPGTLNWYTVSSGGTSIGANSPFNPVGVAGSGLPNTTIPGNTIFYAECAAAAGCRTAVNFLINPLPTITGNLNICIGATAALTGSVSPAAVNPWLSSNTSVATVNSSGVVSGIAAGTSVITYSNNNGCIITATVTVIAPAISGTLSVCTGATTQLTGSGTPAISTPWQSSNTAIANITNTGLVSGISTGNVTITYTNSNGCMITAALIVNADATITLTSATSTTSQTLCVNNSIAPITYQIGGGGTGATVSGLPAGVSGSYNPGTKIYTISGIASVSGTFNYTVTTTGPCVKPVLNGTITVQANSTITRTSAAATTAQTVCINTAIANIVYTIGGGATNATVTGLPAGVTGLLSGNTFTISGVPGTNAGSPFSYTVTATGPCVNALLSGTVTVNADATIALTSSAATTTQTVCVNTPINSISYQVGGGGTGASISGFPAGITGAYNTTTKVFTISGTPSVSGIFNYTVTTTGPCIKPSLTGTLTVTANSTITLTSAAATTSQTICTNTTLANITYVVGGTGTGANVTLLPAGVTGSYNSVTKIFTITGTPTVTGTFNYTITTTGPCANASVSGSINTLTAPSGIISTSENSGIAANDNIICTGSPVVFTATGGYNSYSFKINGSTVQSGNSNVFSSSTLANGASVTVDVANGLNCGSTFGPVVITVHTLPTATLSASATTTCADDTVTFTAAGGVNYAFKINGLVVQSSTINTYEATGLLNGDAVSVDVTNANGCLASSVSIPVTVNALPTGVVSASSTEICSADNVTLTAPAGFASYQFFADGISVQGPNANNIYTASFLNPSVVTVRVSNSNCSAFIDTVVINVNALPAGLLSATENSGIADDNSICAGTVVNFSATPGFANYDFKVNGNSVQNSSSGIFSVSTLLSGDIITVEVSNNENCKATFNPVVITVVASPSGTLLASPSSICEGDNITFTATAGYDNYNFRINNNTVQNGTGNVFSSNSMMNGDVITVEVTNTNSCITSFNSINLTVSPLPAAVLIAVENSGNAFNDGIICAGTSIVFTAPGGFSNYNFLQDGVSVQNGSANTFTSTSAVTGQKFEVAVTNSNNCIGLSNAIIVTVNPLPPPVEPITGDLSVCVTDSTLLQTISTGGTWSSLSNSIATVSTSGEVIGISAGGAIIQYTVSNTDGCIQASSASITVNPLPVVAAVAGTLSVCVNSTTALSNATSGGIWSSSDEAIATVNAGGLITGISAGSSVISYTVTNVHGCTDLVSVVMVVHDLPLVAPITIAAPAISFDVCVNASVNVANATARGVWSIDAPPNIAAINSAGLLTGINEGTTTIRYTVTDGNGCVNEATENITVNPLPTPTLNGANPICPNSTEIYTTEPGFFNYVWTFTGGTKISGGTSADNFIEITWDLPGTRSLFVNYQNAFGCSGFTSATLTTTTGIVPGISGPGIVCQNSTVIYTTQAGQTDYSWAITGGTVSSGGTSTDSTVTILWNNSGSASIAVNFTDMNGCTGVNPTVRTIIINPFPTVVTHDQAVCFPATANLTSAAVTTGSSVGLAFTYWEDADATMPLSNPSAAGAGTYYIKGTRPSSGCFDLKAVTITVTAPPSASIDYPGSPFCTSTSSVAVVFSGTPSGTFSATAGLVINSADGSITPSSSSAGAYMVTYSVAASGGCPVYTTTAGVTITQQPSAIISYAGTPFCNNGAAANVTRTGTPGGTYSSSAGLTIDAATGVITPVTSTQGTYTVDYTIAASGGCAQFSTTAIIDITTPPSATISYTGSPFCTNSGIINVSRAGSAGGSYSSTAGLSINNSTGAINTTASNGGTYTVRYTIAEASGCGIFETSTTVTVTTAPIAVAGTVIATCANDGAVNITAGSSVTNGGSVTWTSNGTGVFANANSITLATYTPSAADITAGSRILTLTAAGNAGCANAVSTKTITINALPTAFAITPSSASICLGAVQPLSAAGGSPTNGSLTFSSGTINLAIPDAGILGNPGSITSTIAVSGVPAGAVINNVSININATHGYDEDLIFNLRAPNGNTLNLVRQRGGSGNNFTNTTISSASVNPINAGAAPFSNTYAADAVNNTGAPNVSNVTAFASLYSTPNGNWIFNAADVVFCHGFLCLGGTYTGTLNSWSITINYTVPTSPVNTVWSPVTGLYTDAGANTIYASQNLSTVFAKPLSNTTYTATATNGAGCTRSQTVAITVNPIPNVMISADYCVVPGKVRLTANSVPVADSYLWSNGATTQSIDVDVAGIYDVTAFGAGTCPGTASINVANELVINGDFSLGNNSFASDYNYKADLPGLVPAGQGELFDDSGNNAYSITTNGQNVHNSFWGQDHTGGPGTRNFMAVNGHGNTLVVWKQTVSVQPNTTYYFSAWAMSLNSSGNYAQLRFSVNGTLVGTSATLSAHGESIGAADNWTRFYGTWTSGPTTTSAEIYINDLQAATSGNDFGLDDISFGSLSTFISLESAPGTDAQVICRNTPITTIIYNVGNGSPTGPNVTGLPPGISSNFDGGTTLTFSGTPTASGVYTYTITTTGSCNPISATGTITVQTPSITLSSGSATTNVCINNSLTIVYTLGGTATGASVTSLPTGINGSVSGNSYTISGVPTSTPGNYPFTITTTGGACTQVTASGTVIVRSQTVTLNSLPATSMQNVCINTPINTIRYAVGGTANNAAVTGLPPGVTGVYNTGFLTISGTPSSAAGSPYTFTVTTSGASCAGASITGTITVTPAAGITLTSAPGTSMQNACNSLAIVPITYAVSNAANASVTSGSLPTGVTGVFSGGVFTISGTPANGGTFNYTITTTGGCASATASGTIIVQAQTISLNSGIASPVLCANTTMANIVFSVGGTGSSASATGLPSGVSGIYNGGLFTISGSPAVTPGSYPYSITTSGVCNPAVFNGTITIQPTATGGNIASLATCAGNSGSLTLTGHAGSIIRWEFSVNSGSSWSPIANTTISNSYNNILAPTMFRAVVGNGCGNVNSAAALVNIHNYWTGVTSQDWNTPSNWSSNMLPSTSCTNVYIPGGTPNQPVLNGGAPASITNLHILSGAVLTVNNNGIIHIGGLISNAGIFDLTDGSVVFNGSSVQNIAGNIFKDSTIRNLTVSNASGVSISNTGGYLKVTEALSFGNVNNATLNTGDNIVLLSSAAKTARVSDITNGGANTGNSFSGKVIVERYIPQRRSWRVLSVPLQQAGSQTFNAAWQEGVVNPDYVYANHLDPHPGYGMLITGPGAGAGFDPSPMNNYSILGFNPITLRWAGVPNTLTAKVTDSAGYMVFVRGDRATQIYLNTAAPISNTILRASGFLKTNLQTTLVPAGVGTYSLVGNPYASSIDLRTVTTSGGVSGTNYVVWDPALTGANGVGAYQYLTRSGGPGTDYLVFPGNTAAGGGSYGAPFSVNNNIQSGQAFLVQNAGAGTVSINENAKIIPTTSTVFRPASPAANPVRFAYISTLLMYENGHIDSLQLVDGALMMYNNSYSNDIDLEDAKKMSNMSSESFGINNGDNWMQIEKRSGIETGDTIFFKAKSYRERDYQFRIEAANIEQDGLTAFLEDAYLHTSTPVSLSGTTVYRFKVFADSGAWRQDRFKIVFKENIVLPVTFSSVKAYRNNDFINVEWKTAHELSIANYDVERSADGIRFEKVYTETNVMNNDRGAAYSWVDKNPLHGINFYRVKSKEINGAGRYTSIVKVAFDKPTAQSITLYPNPLIDATFNLYFVNEETGNYKLRLLNSAGQLIEAAAIKHAATSPTEVFRPTQQLLHGTYMLEITKPGGAKQTISAVY